MCMIDIKEILGAKICEEVLINSLSLYKKSIDPWLICCEEGGIIQNFGKEADELINEITFIFEKDASVFQDTKVYVQKKEVLREKILHDLQKIFEKQIQKTKEMSFLSFKESLAPIQITNQVERDIQAVIKTIDSYFTEIAGSLCSKKSSGIWFYEKEHQELKQGMIEIAIEKLQMARLQGIYLQKNRNPISLSFHFLHPHPFGKDLRFDHMTTNDSFNFNSRISQKAGIMRQSVSAKEKSLKITQSDSATTASENDLIYQENPLNAFQNNNY
nr:SEY1 [Cryptomonas sp.]